MKENNLIQYALRNPKTLKYKSRLGTSGELTDAQLFSSFTEAERWSHDKYTQIRKIVITDLGDANE